MPEQSPTIGSTIQNPRVASGTVPVLDVLFGCSGVGTSLGMCHHARPPDPPDLWLWVVGITDADDYTRRAIWKLIVESLEMARAWNRVNR